MSVNNLRDSYSTRIRRKMKLDRNTVLLVFCIVLSLLFSVLRFPLDFIDSYWEYAGTIKDVIRTQDYELFGEVKSDIRNRPGYPFFVAIFTYLIPIPLSYATIVLSVLSILISLIFVK